MSLSFLSKENPLIANIKKGKFLTPWFLAPFILYYITEYISPVSTASTSFFLNKQHWIPDWWNILDLWSFLYTVTGNATFHRIQFSMPFIVSWILVLIGYIFQTAAEEIYIRGWLIPTISYHTNALLAILISATMFSYFHVNNNGASWFSTVHLFFFGVFTAVYALKRGNIWGPCGFHFAWNFLMGNVYGFHVSGFDSESSLMYFTTSNHTLITGGEFGPEGGIPGLVVCILALLWAIFILKDTSKEQESLYPAALK